MKIEIITTGDEIMQGVIVDTNTAWIAERIHALGHEVMRHSSVGDDIEKIVALLSEAASRADAVIVSGGLGPTADDLTIEAAARAFKAKLVRDEDVLEDIREFFKGAGRPMSSSNEKQALIPEGALALPNKVGTAPGVRARFENAEFFFLPGVPKELYQIFDDSVVPWFEKNAENSAYEKVLRCFGMPEATIDDKLQGVDLHGTKLGFRVKFPEVLLKVLTRSKYPAEAKVMMERVTSEIKARLADVVYGEGNTPLAAVVGQMLVSRNMTLAVAESCTGGLIANLITDEPGSSAYFERGVVTYSNRSKKDILGVTEETLERYGAVSPQTAMAMAEGIRRISGATIGVGVTGIAGPGGGTVEKPVGTVHIAIATGEGTRNHEYRFNRDRLWFKQLAAWTALDLVRRLHL